MTYLSPRGDWIIAAGGLPGNAPKANRANTIAVSEVSDRDAARLRMRRGEHVEELLRSPALRSGLVEAPSLTEPCTPGPDGHLFLQRTIDALPLQVVILGETGRILMANRAWQEFALESGTPAGKTAIGCSYLEVCPAAGGTDDQAWQAHEAIAALLAGGRAEFELELAIDMPAGRREFILHATRLAGSGPTRVLVAHEDVTSLKQMGDRLHRLMGQSHAREDEARRQIARELHDETAQKLVAACLLLANVDRRMGGSDPAARKGIAEVKSFMEEALSEIRSLSYLFHPPLLAELGLAAAMRAYVDGFGRRTAIRMQMDAIEEIPPLARDAEMALYRVLQEALANVYRHAKSETALVGLYHRNAETRLEVMDQGIGIAGAGADGRIDPARGGVGLLAMKIRMEQIGGDIEIQTGDNGTCIRAILPDRTPGGSSTRFSLGEG
jgi:signal transduction histidine kinase